MNRTTVQVKGVQREALITHEHKMLLIPSEKQQMVAENCHLTAIRGAQYTWIKIARASESRLELQKNKLTASQLDLELETRVTDEYLMWSFEGQLRDRVKDMSFNALTQHDKHRELSPFQSHSIIKRRGQLIVELQFTPVTTEAVLGERRKEK